MKLFKYISAVAAVMFAVSCDGEKLPDPILATDIGSTTVNLEGEKFVFDITSNLDWEIAKGDAAWLNISPLSGKEDSEVTCTFPENNTEEDRKATVTITGYQEGELKKTLTYTLVFKGSPVQEFVLSTDLPGSTITLPEVQSNEADLTGSFTLVSELDWKIEYQSSWIVFGPTSGGPADGRLISYRFAKNEGSNPVETTVDIIGLLEDKEVERLTYKFILPVHKEFGTSISDNSLVLPNIQPGKIDISIYAGGNWAIEYDSDASWLSFSKTSGTGNATVECSFGENNSGELMTANVDFIAMRDGKEFMRIERSLILPQKFEARLSTDIVGSTVTLPDYPQPGEFDIKLSSNVDWVIGTDASWLSFDITEGEGNGSTTGYFIANTTGSDLKATVYVKGYYEETQVASLEYEFILPPKDSFVPILSPDLPRHKILPLEQQPGEFEFDMDSNMEWKIEYDYNVSWIGFVPDSGSSGTTTVKCLYGKNNEGHDLETTVYIVGYQTTEEGRRERVRLEYKFTLPAFIGVLTTDLNIGDGVFTLPSDQPGEMTVNISSNLDWTITEGSQWLSFTPASGNGNGQVVCRFDAVNLNSNPQNTTVTISGTHQMLNEPIILRYRFDLPPATPHLGFDLPESTVILDGAQPGSVEIDVISNLKWQVVNGAPDWLTFTPASGSENGTVVCSYIENTTGHDLDTTVTLVGRRLDGTEIVSRVEYNFILPSAVVPE